MGENPLNIKVPSQTNAANDLVNWPIWRPQNTSSMKRQELRCVVGARVSDP